MVILVMNVEKNTAKTETGKKHQFSLYRPAPTGLLESFYCVLLHSFTVSNSIYFIYSYFGIEIVIIVLKRELQTFILSGKL